MPHPHGPFFIGSSVQAGIYSGMGYYMNLLRKEQERDRRLEQRRLGRLESAVAKAKGKRARAISVYQPKFQSCYFEIPIELLKATRWRIVREGNRDQCVRIEKALVPFFGRYTAKAIALYAFPPEDGSAHELSGYLPRRIRVKAVNS